MIDCRLVSPKKIEVYKNIKNIVIPAAFGQMQILPNHAESFVKIKEGDIIIKNQNKKSQSFPVLSGIFYIKNNNAVIILQ